MKALDQDGLDYVVDKIYDLVNSGGSADYIVEEGQSGIWTYRKWASGVAECWGKTTITLSGTGTLWKTPIYAYLGVNAQNYPFEFYEVPTETVSVTQAQNAVWLYKQAYAEMNNTKTKTATYALIKVDAFDNGSTAVLSYHVKGLWKEFTPSAVSSSYQLQADYVVEQGTSGNWKYRKWASGNADAFLRANYVRSGNSSALVTTTSEINTVLGVTDASPSNTIVQCANGNASIQPAHIEGTTVDEVGNWYVLFDRAVSGTITINSYILYLGKV